MSDFFISYTANDRSWAEWVAWQLEDAGYSTILQAWDFHPGSNFVLEMQKATAEATRTIVILSSAFLASAYTQPEWAAAFAKDPQGIQGLLIPVRVESVKPEGLLSQVVYIDLVGKDENYAQIELISGVQKGRAKPKKMPDYPGEKSRSMPNKPIAFPGSLLPSPVELIPYVDEFAIDYPDPRRTAFIMMPHKVTPAYNKIVRAIQTTLQKHGIEAFQGSEKDYLGQILDNTRIYMHACGFGIAVFDQIDSHTYNSHIIWEFGYMFALGKPICLLRDSSLSDFPFDMFSFLYIGFDGSNPEFTIEKAINTWLQEKGII